MSCGGSIVVFMHFFEAILELKLFLTFTYLSSFTSWYYAPLLCGYLILLITPRFQTLEIIKSKEPPIPEFIETITINKEQPFWVFQKSQKNPRFSWKNQQKPTGLWAVLSLFFLFGGGGGGGIWDQGSKTYNRRVFGGPPPTIFWYPPNTVGHMVGVKKVTPFYSGEKGKR